jgi:uncharacterized protein (DUF4415 family)
MANAKRKKIQEVLNKTPKEKFGDEDLLSADLAARVGSLADRTKVTIRLDSRVIETAKKLDEALGGIGYQKIINDRLLSSFGFQNEPTYQKFNEHSVEELLDEMMDMKSRLNELEKKQA